MSKNHLTKEDRIKIQVLLTAKHSQSFIAQQLGFNPSSISREIKRNCRQDGCYDPIHANHLCLVRRSNVNQSHRVLSTSPNKKDWNWLTHIVDRKISKHDWSPDQVSGWLKKRHRVIIAVQTIYDWIYLFAKHLKQHLHHIRGGYRKNRERYINKRHRDELKRKKGIENRGECANSRKYYGHFEGDTIVGRGHTGRIATFVERKSGYLMAFLITNLSPELKKLDEIDLESQRLNLAARFADGAVEQFNQKVNLKYQKTLTLDNGSEMAWHEWIERGSKLEVFFANPYHSWERGTNENTNGLLRFYFPKSLPFTNLTQKDVDIAVKKLNNRPRKRLQYRTPQDVLKRAGVLL